MMEERKENDFKMDTEDLRLLNAFGEALGDLPSEEETRAAWNAFASRQDARKRRRIIQMWTSGIAAAIVVLAVLIVPRITGEDTIQDIEIFAALDVPEAIITSESNGRITLSTPQPLPRKSLWTMAHRLHSVPIPAWNILNYSPQRAPVKSI